MTLDPHKTIMQGLHWRIDVPQGLAGDLVDTHDFSMAAHNSISATERPLSFSRLDLASHVMAVINASRRAAD